VYLEQKHIINVIKTFNNDDIGINISTFVIKLEFLIPYMKEIIFIQKNLDKWKVTEKSLKELGKIEPAEIANMYQDISSDLAFAQTHYSKSEIVPYLNSMALKLHNNIYGNKQQRWNSILLFWTKEIPTEMYRQRKFMILSFVIFITANIIGVVSQLGNENFAVDFFGDYYINMTLQNIKEGNPMGVYGKEAESYMFAGITINNIRVSFIEYISGVFTFFMTGLILLNNSIMCGTFLTFCYQHNVLSDCMLAMWMHGVIEISSIIIAAGTGFVLSSGWMFPGSLPRLASFRLAMKSSVKIIMGLVPFFIVAGFIESYITRHTDAPNIIRLGVIFGSLAFVIYYFVVLPYKVHKKAVDADE